MIVNIIVKLVLWIFYKCTCFRAHITGIIRKVEDDQKKKYNLLEFAQYMWVVYVCCSGGRVEQKVGYKITNMVISYEFELLVSTTKYL